MKINATRMEVIRRKLGYLNGIEVAIVGSRGGLCLGWNEGITVDLHSFDLNYIDVMVTDPIDNLKWRLTDFYGEPDGRRRAQSWELLKSLDQSYNYSWVVIGDFNEIISHNEK